MARCCRRSDACQEWCNRSSVWRDKTVTFVEVMTLQQQILVEREDGIEAMEEILDQGCAARELKLEDCAAAVAKAAVHSREHRLDGALQFFQRRAVAAARRFGLQLSSAASKRRGL